MTSFLKKDTVQSILIYAGVGLFLLLMGFGIFSAISDTSEVASKEEVHWHAEISYEACGNKVTFDDEKGHTLTHGHNDELVHVEGIVFDENDATLASFFTNSDVNITSENFEDYKNGDACNFSSGPGSIAFYVDEVLFTNPEEILIKDKQVIRVVFE